MGEMEINEAKVMLSARKVFVDYFKFRFELLSSYCYDYLYSLVAHNKREDGEYDWSSSVAGESLDDMHNIRNFFIELDRVAGETQVGDYKRISFFYLFPKDMVLSLCCASDSGDFGGHFSWDLFDADGVCEGSLGINPILFANRGIKFGKPESFGKCFSGIDFPKDWIDAGGNDGYYTWHIANDGQKNYADRGYEKGRFTDTIFGGAVDEVCAVLLKRLKCDIEEAYVFFNNGTDSDYTLRRCKDRNGKLVVVLYPTVDSKLTGLLCAN